MEPSQIPSVGGGSRLRKQKREKISNKLLREGAPTPLSEPKSSQHWLEIGPERLRSDLRRIGAPPGRSWDAPETVCDALRRLRDASGTLPGGFGTLPGRSRNAPGRSLDTFGMSWDRFLAQLAHGNVLPSIRFRFSGHFPMVF